MKVLILDNGDLLTKQRSAFPYTLVKTDARESIPLQAEQKVQVILTYSA